MKRKQAEKTVNTYNPSFQKRLRKLHVVTTTSKYRAFKPIEEECLICETLDGEPIHIYNSHQEVADEARRHGSKNKKEEWF